MWHNKYPSAKKKTVHTEGKDACSFVAARFPDCDFFLIRKLYECHSNMPQLYVLKLGKVERLKIKKIRVNVLSYCKFCIYWVGVNTNFTI